MRVSAARLSMSAESKLLPPRAIIFATTATEKTTVADLGKAIGLSKAYIYKFFELKQAIGQAVCGMCLGEISAAAMAIVKEPRSASDRLRRIFKVVAQRSGDMFFHDRKIYDLAEISLNEKWAPLINIKKACLRSFTPSFGMAARTGEFERKTPLEETAESDHAGA